MRTVLKDTRPCWFCQRLADAVSSVLELSDLETLRSWTVVVSNRLTGGAVVMLLFEGDCWGPWLGLEDWWVMTVLQDNLWENNSDIIAKIVYSTFPICGQRWQPVKMKQGEMFLLDIVLWAPYNRTWAKVGGQKILCSDSYCRWSHPPSAVKTDWDSTTATLSSNLTVQSLFLMLF